MKDSPIPGRTGSWTKHLGILTLSIFAPEVTEGSIDPLRAALPQRNTPGLFELLRRVREGAYYILMGWSLLLCSPLPSHGLRREQGREHQLHLAFVWVVSALGGSSFCPLPTCCTLT